MKSTSSQESSHRFRHGDYQVEFQQDPLAPREPKRFVKLVRAWRHFANSVYQVPAAVYYGLTATFLAVACWDAYYFEKILVYVIVGAIAFLGIYLVRNHRFALGFLGLLLSIFGWIGLATIWIGSEVDGIARTFATPRVVAAGGEIQTFGAPELDSLNLTMQQLFQRDAFIVDIMAVRGPLEAFPPRIVRDLRVPSNIAITITEPQHDDIDWSDNLRAIAPKSPMLLGSWWNDATCFGLIPKGLNCELLIFDQPLTDAQLALVATPKLRYNTLRLQWLEAGDIKKLAEAINANGHSIGNLYLVACHIDPASAVALAQAKPTLIIDHSQELPEKQLPVEELDAMVNAGLNLKKLFANRIDGARAERLAKFPNLELLTGTLIDDAAVEALSGSQLDNVHVSHLNDAIVASLMKYPKLTYVSIDTLEGSLDVAMPLITNQALFGISVRTFRGTAAEIKRLQTLPRITIGSIEVVSEE